MGESMNLNGKTVVLTGSVLPIDGGALLM